MSYLIIQDKIPKTTCTCSYNVTLLLTHSTHIEANARDLSFNFNNIIILMLLRKPCFLKFIVSADWKVLQSIN